MSQFILALLIILSFLTGPAYAGNLSFDSYYHNDHLGSPVAVTDERGDLLWRAHFRPYGERQESPADAAFGNIGYTGHTQDADSGLVYMQARYYDPVIGRFMAIDPVEVNPESPISFNRYAYANSNPMRFIDPDGRMSKELPGGRAWAPGFETRTLVGDGGWGPITGTKRGLTPQGELVNGGAVKGVPKGVDYSRPSGYRAGVRDKAWDNAKEASTGQVRDPATGRFMSKDKAWDMGHKPGHEFKKHQQSAQERGISRKQFLDEHNNSNNYRPELPGSNRSHRGEDKTNSYFGP